MARQSILKRMFRRPPAEADEIPELPDSAIEEISAEQMERIPAEQVSGLDHLKRMNLLRKRLEKINAALENNPDDHIAESLRRERNLAQQEFDKINLLLGNLEEEQGRPNPEPVKPETRPQKNELPKLPKTTHEQMSMTDLPMSVRQLRRRK